MNWPFSVYCQACGEPKHYIYRPIPGNTRPAMVLVERFKEEAFSCVACGAYNYLLDCKYESDILREYTNFMDSNREELELLRPRNTFICIGHRKPLSV